MRERSLRSERIVSTDYGHPLRFGVAVPPAEPGTAIELARLAEELGLDLVTVLDDPDALDAWTLLSWIAGATNDVRLAVDGLDLVRRPAAVAARAAASLDLIAGQVPLRPRQRVPGQRRGSSPRAGRAGGVLTRAPVVGAGTVRDHSSGP